MAWVSGVAEADVEFDQLRAGRGQHQPGEENALERCAACLHARQGRLDDLAHDAGFEGRRHGGGRRDGAHAPGIGARVALTHPLMVLRRAERQGMGAVAEGKEGDLLALEEILDHDRGAGRAENRRRT